MGDGHLKKIRVSGILYVPENETDPDHPMGLTADAAEKYRTEIGLEDVEFVREDD